MSKLMTMKMRFKKNQKGLTLVELLAVIVILGIVSAIAVPSITGIINSTKTKADLASIEMVKSAVRNKVLSENLTATPATTTIASLATEGYLAEVPIWNGTQYVDYSATYNATTNAWTINVVTPPITE